MAEETKQEKGFRVSDRRRFTEVGEARKPDPPQGQEGSAAAPEGKAKREAPAGGAKEGPRREQQQRPPVLPEINFSTFIVSLSSSALIHLGLAPDPVSGETRKDLALAKQTIDILGILKEKTTGNLTDEETQLMDSILYDLRMRYVQESK